jgi:hypothetical protein
MTLFQLPNYFKYKNSIIENLLKIRFFSLLIKTDQSRWMKSRKVENGPNKTI